MRRRVRPLTVALSLVFLTLMVGEVTFSRPLRRITAFELSESANGVTVHIPAASVESVESENGKHLEFHSISGVTLRGRAGLSRSISPALLFEVFAADPRMLMNLEINERGLSSTSATNLESSAMTYRCCGEDSLISLKIDALPDLPSTVMARTNPVLSFEVLPSGCVYDLPKVYCQFATLTSGGPIVVDGGSILMSDFGGVDFRGAVFLNLDLRGTSFAGANLHGAMFRNVNLMDVDFTGANLDQTIFRNVESDEILGRP